MNHFAFAAGWQLCRIQLPLLTLLLFLQRTPVLRLLTSAPSAWMSAPLGQTLRASALVATALGAVDTLAGATRFTASPSSPASATAGENFSAIFAVTGAPGTTQSYTVENLPPGLSVSGASFDGTQFLLNASTGAITGTPTSAGTFQASITAYEGPNASQRSVTYLYTINVTGGVTVTAPSITSHPSSQSVTDGGSATFSVSADGTAPLTYQWVKDNNNISGANSSSYTINPVNSSHAGNYWCVVTNSAGSATTNAASLGVNSTATAPSITSQPASLSVNEGTSATFSVGVSGTQPITYQWLKNGSNISGANSSSFTISSAISGDSASYSCFVSNGAGSVTSNGATLTVIAAVVAPSFTSHPATQTVNTGATVVFSYTATGTAPFLQQWYKDNVAIPGATGATYTISSATLNDAGAYRVEIANNASNVTSNTATLTVNPAVIAPSFTTHPASQSVNVGVTVTFSYAATGTAPFAQQWYKNNIAISGATAATYTINSATLADAGSYRVEVANAASNVSSNAATLTVNQLTQTLTFVGPTDQGFTLTPLTLSASSTSGLSPTFVLVSGPATLNGTALTLTGPGTVTLRAEQAGDATYTAAAAVTRSFVVSANFAYWQYQHFTLSELAAGTLTGPTTIVTADGLANLVKYALGLDPKSVATSGLPTASAAGGNWTFTYTRPSGQTDIAVGVEASSDLTTWSTNNVTLTLLGSTSGTDTWQATVPQSGAANLFFRLRVTRP